MTEGTCPPASTNPPDSDKWDLTHLFADVDKWSEDFAWIQQTYPQLHEWKGRLGESRRDARRLPGIR